MRFSSCNVHWFQMSFHFHLSSWFFYWNKWNQTNHNEKRLYFFVHGITATSHETDAQWWGTSKHNQNIHRPHEKININCQFLYEIKVLRLEMVASQPAVLIMHANEYDTPDEHSAQFFLSSVRINALIFKCNSNQFTQENISSILKMGKSTMKSHTKIREQYKKICDENEDKPQLIRALTEAQEQQQ